MAVRILTGDCRDLLKSLPDESVHCVVTSPPYWGLRDYGTAKWEGGDQNCDHLNGRPGSWRADGIVENVSQRNRDGAGAYSGDCRKCGAVRVDSQLGLEQSPDAYVAQMVAVFRDVWRVLRKDGTLWLNLGDSYSTHAAGKISDPMLKSTLAGVRTQEVANESSRANGRYRKTDLLPEKNLIGIPWRVAFALQADGWYLRQDIIWAKPNPMPESVTDRCTKAHEYIFLLSKSERYYYDQQAIAEPSINAGETRVTTDGGFGRSAIGLNIKPTGNAISGSVVTIAETRNKRSVWTIATEPFSEAHFATFPTELIKPCILAGCPVDGTVLDPFAGAGTTGIVADRLQRNAILMELNAAYIAMMTNRLADDAGMFAQIENCA